MAETLSLISLISFLAAGVFAVLAVVLWFVFHIPTVAGELSGRTARKSIERMRKSNAEAAKNLQGPDPVKGDKKNARGPDSANGDEKTSHGSDAAKGDKKTARRSDSARGDKKTARRSDADKGDKKTARRSDSAKGDKKNARGSGSARGEKKNPYADMRQAGSRGDNWETVLLAENADRARHNRETEVLADGEYTKIADSGNAQTERRVSAIKIEVLEDIVFIHTKEVIE